MARALANPRGARLQACDRPACVLPGGAQIPRPARAVVDAKLAFHPELHGVGTQTIAAPIRRPRHLHGDAVGFAASRAVVGNPKPACRCSNAALECLTRFDRLALLAGPGAEAALPGPGAKVRVVLGIRQEFDGTLRAHLPVAVIPVKYRRGPAGGLKFQALARSIVGIEKQAAELGVDLFAEHDTRRRGVG